MSIVHFYSPLSLNNNTKEMDIEKKKYDNTKIMTGTWQIFGVVKCPKL
jgi:hypothetical protein